jgi:hypothetical protein
MNGPAVVGRLKRTGIPTYIPICRSHKTIWAGSPSHFEALAKTNAAIHNTDMHPKTEEPTLFEVTT